MRALFAGLVAAAIGSAAITAPAAAQDFPTKPVRMLIPFPPGGFVDILGRLVAAKMSDHLGQNVLVDNRPGANGNIALDAVAKSAPDGYTIIQAQVSNLAVNPALYKDLPFDPLKDLAPVGFVGTASQVMVVAAGSQIQSVADMVAAAKAKPGELMFASSGNGSLGHLGFELIQQQAGIKFTHVPYKGAAPAVIDVIGGRAHLFIAAMPSVIGHIRGGKLKAIAVTARQRAPELPDVPPLNEAGFPGYETTNWLAIMTRAGTQQPVIDRLNAALEKALQNDDAKARFAKEGATVRTSTPKELGDVLAADITKWRNVVTKAGIKIQ